MITNPTRQRALRGHKPTRPTPRVANTAEHQAVLAWRLTPRDKWIARMLWEHKVLTAHQITALAFPSFRSGRMRLRELYLWGVVDRFQPFVTLGTAPMHYVPSTITRRPRSTSGMGGRCRQVPCSISGSIAPRHGYSGPRQQRPDVLGLRGVVQDDQHALVRDRGAELGGQGLHVGLRGPPARFRVIPARRVHWKGSASDTCDFTP